MVCLGYALFVVLDSNASVCQPTNEMELGGIGSSILDVKYRFSIRNEKPCSILGYAIMDFVFLRQGCQCHNMLDRMGGQSTHNRLSILGARYATFGLFLRGLRGLRGPTPLWWVIAFPEISEWLANIGRARISADLNINNATPTLPCPAKWRPISSEVKGRDSRMGQYHFRIEGLIFFCTSSI